MKRFLFIFIILIALAASFCAGERWTAFRALKGAPEGFPASLLTSDPVQNGGRFGAFEEGIDYGHYDAMRVLLYMGNHVKGKYGNKGLLKKMTFAEWFLVTEDIMNTSLIVNRVPNRPMVYEKKLSILATK